MSLSLGIDLWDKPETIVSFNEDNTIIFDKLQKIFGEFCKNNLTHISVQKRIFEKFLNENDSLKTSEYNFSSNAYILSQEFLNAISVQETFSNELLNEVDHIIKTKLSSTKKESRNMKNEKKKLFDDLAKENQKLDDDFKKYRNKYNAKDLAHRAFTSAEQNKALSLNQVENYHSTFISRKSQYEETKKEYKTTLLNFNNYQMKHYTTFLEDWGLKAQNIEKERYNTMKAAFTHLSELCRNVASKFNVIADNIESRVDLIECDKDCLTLINKYKTGDVPPEDVPFQDFDSQENNEDCQEGSRTSKISNSGSDSIPSSDTQKNSVFFQTKKKTQSLSRHSSLTNHNENGAISNGVSSSGNKFFGKLFSGNKKTKEVSGQNSHPQIGNMESLQEQKSSDNSDNPDSGNTEQEINPTNNTSLKNEYSVSKKTNFKRKMPFFLSLRNKSFDDPNMASKGKSLFEKHNQTSENENGRSKSIPSLRPEETDRIDMKSTISSNNPKKVPKPKIRPKPIMKVPKIIDHNEEESGNHHSKSIEVIRLTGPVEIVSTPAEALASIARSSCAFSSNHEELYSDITNNEDKINTKEEGSFSYFYVGSCVAIHEYKNNDTLKIYLSFDIGEQFYIIQENATNEGSGWLLVERIDRSQSGYVPTTYMDTRWFDAPIEMFSDHPMTTIK